jgi:DNA-binding MarR family transcriptional regulator
MKPTSESKVSRVAERTVEGGRWEGAVTDEDARSASDEFFMLWALIAQTKDAILRARELEYARYGISNERRAILAIIQNNGGRSTPVDIARDLFRELHSVTEMLARMEKDGLVLRHKGTGRSKVEVSLTDQGMDVFRQSLHNETDKKIFTALTKKQRERLTQYLWRLRSRTMEHLGIPEWQLSFVPEPNQPENQQEED